MRRLAVAHRTPASALEVQALTACGATVFEVDVRLHGGALLATHDRPLRRPRLAAGPRLRLGIDPRTPSLDAVLDLVPDGGEVLLDLKDDRAPASGLLARELAERLPRVDRLYASSHDWAALSLLSRVGVRTWRTVGSRRAARALLEGGLQDAWGVTVRRTLLQDPRTCDALLRAADGRVVAWTVNRVDEAEGLLARGVLGLTTDACEVLRLVR